MDIALTGSIGSGKSSVGALLAYALEADIVNTDTICRDLLQPHCAGWRSVCEQWPGDFISSDGQLDRALLREAVFTDMTVRHKLESILHPLVRQQVEERMAQNDTMGRNLIIEVPLLFEVEWDVLFTHVVAVYAPRHACLARTMKRDHLSREQAGKILAAQLAPEEKARRAGSVIDNSGLWVQTVLQVSYLARKLQHLGIE